MPEYRIEISPNKRAGCHDTVCKKEGVKIGKGEIRFGTWVEIKEQHGSWHWKHWGCVSGAQIAGLQVSCGGDPTNYDYTAIDGFDELDDNEAKEKIQRCIMQGHIDPEDFKGDPEKNKLGEKGIYLTAKQKAAKEKAAAVDADEDEATPAKKPNKRGRKKAADDTADEPKPKKARKSKTVEADEEQPEAKAKANAKDASEEDAEGSAPAKKGRPRRSITQQDEKVEDEETEEPASAKKATKKGSKAKASKSQPEEEAVEEDEVKEKEKATPAKATRGRKPSASRAKTATTDEDEDAEKAIPAPAPRGRRRAAVSKTDEKAEDTPKPIAKRGRKSSTPAKKSTPEPTEAAEEEEDKAKVAPKTRGRGRPRKSDGAAN